MNSGFSQSSLHAVRTAKKHLRAQMKLRRDQAYAQIPDASEKLCANFLQHMSIPAGSIIASYRAIGSELSPHFLADSLHDKGFTISLPVIVAPHMPLVFRRYQPGDTLVTCERGIEEPAPDADELMPDILLVPLLAFNNFRARLGYGGGYYDRTLSGLRKRKKILGYGIAFNMQEVIDIPTNPFDAPLDAIITEDRIY